MNEDKVINILVADDEEDIRDIVRSHLESEGYRVITSENGEEAINALNEFDISLAITDLKMPKMDGREVLSDIKTDQKLRYIPVVILTTSEAEEDIIKTYSTGANCYVTKPIGLEQFSKVVKSIEDFWFTVVKLPPR